MSNFPKTVSDRAHCHLLLQNISKTREKASCDELIRNLLDLLHHNNCPSFGNYLISEWLSSTNKEEALGIDRSSRWAGFGRPRGTVINTTMKIERFNKTLKEYFLKRKSVSRLDYLIHKFSRLSNWFK
ncbi:MAG: hypothetical protein GY820_42365 [Gammaproteobacteria bacterium]|nr:hypothetical protein [Gammaproteobacteria bacterium]